ncbi:Hypothetical predicted protein [Mytilus galloprovincialis]|uniref:Uncharacterized protein n=1 Tax=Mytilus galloprovincialis TaxID=29158 RepID=A0A8B6BQY7_MYTGA|nr:Hypothetical predicted protein [Mytilus galloprovincialis]
MYDTLSNKTTLVTPKGSYMCGPVVLNVGSSYFLSVSVYGEKMHHNLCQLQVEVSSASNKLLVGLAGKYQENCDCEVCFVVLAYVGCYKAKLYSLINVT